MVVDIITTNADSWKNIDYGEINERSISRDGTSRYRHLQSCGQDNKHQLFVTCGASRQA